jgi:hypothetical protein
VKVPLLLAAAGSTITEAGAVVFQHGAFVAGRAGVIAAHVGAGFVAFECAPGNFSWGVRHQ